MGPDLWFREDVARILAGAHEGMASSASALPVQDPEAAAAYYHGFADALRIVAVAFGVTPPGQSPRQEWLSASSAIEGEYHTQYHPRRG